jgi:hypothetical protein
MISLIIAFPALRYNALAALKKKDGNIDTTGPMLQPE